MIKVRKATYGDAITIGTNLREADRAEIAASCGGHPVTAVIQSFDSSVEAWCVTKGDELAFIFGVSKYEGGGGLSGIGVPWMLATPIVDECPKALARAGLKYVDKMQQMFHTLTNCTDLRNEKVLRWLGWMGFTFFKVHPEYGVGKLPFVQFVRYKNV